MKFESIFRPKSKEELEKQTQSAEGVLGKKIYPSDLSKDDILDVSKIKDKYKTRYDAYITTLRAIRRGDLNTEEIKHAKEWITALNNLDDYIKDHESKNDPLLREKQFVVFKKIRDFLEEGKREGYIKLPAGTGKTILFSKIAEALDMKTLVVSPSIIILEQNAEETEKFTDSEFGKYYNLEKDLSKKITHITYNSLINIVKDKKINPDEVPVLILDEAHRSLGPESAQVVNQFKGLKLGFTATSKFSENKKLSNLLEEEIFRMDIVEAIQEGLICQTQTIHAYTNVDLSSVKIKKGEYDQNQLEKVINVHGRNMAALEFYKNKFNHLKAICNCSGVKHAEDVTKLFNENGIFTACITGNTPKNEREKIIDDYKNGVIKVLTNARVLLEGFNEPSCSVTFNLSPTLSFVVAEQRVRSGRLDKNNLDKWNYVIDFIDQNSQKPQILYSEILGSDRVWDITKSEIPELETKKEEANNLTREKRPLINLNDFYMDGLKVVVETRQIMEITKRNIESKEKWTYETLRDDVIAKGIKSSSDYEKNIPKNNWPNRITITSKLEFPKNPDGSNDWDTFLGREKFNFEKFREEVIVKGIKSSSDYEKNAPKNNWPSTITITSKLEFPKNPDGSNDWDTFLGREKFNFEKFREEVIAKGIKSTQDYAKNAPKNNWPGSIFITSYSEFPKNPDGSNDWDTFLGREKFNFEKFREEVIVKGIKNSADYIKNASKNKWPNAKTITSKSEFPKLQNGKNDWDTFLRRNN